ncbi:MAG: hypothetical protein HUU56_00465 [Bdellovibrionaceae bacterium]|nr:hypothetical protein [Pseudobdellovibrionaceae bacterium]
MQLLLFALKKEIASHFLSLNDERVQLLVTGVGKLNAAINLTKFLASKSSIFLNKDQLVIINLGTAGSKFFPIGSLVEVAEFYERDTFFPSSKLTFPSITSLPKAICGSGDQLININDPLFKDSPWNIVDMEAYALAKTCQAWGLKFVSIKYITDNSNENVKKQWQLQIDKAREALYHYWIDQLKK